MNRTGLNLGATQPIEQCTFQRGFIGTDHILTRVNEYPMPLYLFFVDFKMHLILSVTHALTEHVKKTAYIKVLYNIYETSSAFISVNEPTADATERRIKQGDPIPPS